MGMYTIGIDMGIASVGWAVLDEDGQILESGANIFPEANASQNADRRNFRQARRLKRRRKTRIQDFNKLWEKNGYAIPDETDNDILLLRIKGLEETLTSDELYAVLRYMLGHRGISYLEDDIDESATGEYKRGLAINQAELQTKLPCQVQAERMEAYSSYRGNNSVEINGEKVTLSNVFTKSAYKRELAALFEVQKKFDDKLSDEFIKAYLNIFDRKREYYEGPGNELSRTDYGKYTTKIDSVTGKFITEDNIFEKLIGKCSVYPEERRAAAASFSAQEFNALNDLNNLVINGRKLEEAEKRAIIAKYKTENVINVRKIIKSVIGEDIETLTGARIDKDEKEQFHTLDVYRKLKKHLTDQELDINTLSEDDLDVIGEILTLNTEREAIEKALLENPIECDERMTQALVSFRKKNGSLFSKWHSFSLKIMKELIPALYEQPKNQMELLTDMGLFKSKQELFADCKEIPTDKLTEEIYNPVVRRSISIAVKVINALIEKYNYPKRIVIEMPRDKNSDEEKERIKKSQKNNESELKNIEKRIKDEYGISITEETYRHHKGLALKLKLWNEQGERCLYSGKSISVDKLIDNQNLFEVDHIIPISISFDDGRSNKVLVYAGENQAKGNRTPFMYLNGINREWGWEQYCAYIKSLKWGSEKKGKLRNLFYSEDITKIDVVKGFINRNLNDTRYASREVLSLLKGYFSAKGSNTVVSVIRGSFTHQMRDRLQLPKDRSESYSHHAVDAMLIALSQMGYDEYRLRQDKIIDFETGEIISEKDWSNQDELYKEILFQQKWHERKVNILAAEKKVKYWYKVDRKCNRGLCNQTIYGTREYEGSTYTIDSLDLYVASDIKRFRDMIAKGKEKDFLMYQHDPKTFETLMNVFHEYRDEANPFLAYNLATGDYVRKYAKDHNGPIIKKIKFRKEKTASCIDISHKYGFEKGSRRVILDTLKPYRMDVYYNKETKLYYFVGIKHSDIKCEGNSYVIDDAAYGRALVSKKMLNPGEGMVDLDKHGYEFRLSFYKDDTILYEKNGETYKERFLSRTMPVCRNYVETKPVDAPKFNKQNLVGLSKTKSVKKIVKDILGNERVIEKEKFVRVVDKK